MNMCVQIKYVASTLIVIAVSMIEQSFLFAQPKPFVMGLISADDLKMKIYPSEPNAVAVLLYDYGRVTFPEMENSQRVFYRYHQQVKILKEEGYGYGTFQVHLKLGSDWNETLLDVAGATYNLVNGRVIRTELQKNQIFEKEIGEDLVEIQFSMPSLRVGSVVEVVYGMSSPVTHMLKEWWFQSSIPTRLCEYQVVIPEYFEYKFAAKGYLPFASQSSVSAIESFSSRDNGNPSVRAIKYSWKMENIPTFERMPFMWSSNDYESHLEFELASYQYPGQDRKVISSDWSSFARTVLRWSYEWREKNEDSDLVRSTKTLIGDANSPIERANRIYKHLQAQVMKTMEWKATTKKALRESSGIEKLKLHNLSATLLEMLHIAGIEANLVALSTTMNGQISENSPLLSEFNYVIVGLKIDGNLQFADLSDPLRPIGTLPPHCLSGKGVLISRDSTCFVPLLSHESDTEIIKVKLDLSEDGQLVGAWGRDLESLAAYRYRLGVVDTIRQRFPEIKYAVEPAFEGWRLADLRSNGMNDLDSNIQQTAKIFSKKTLSMSENSLTIAPMMGLAISENWFSAPTRIYPVDIGYRIKKHVEVMISVPNGYRCEKIPAGILVVLPDGGGKFRFTSKVVSGKIYLSSTLAFDKPSYSPKYYPALRELVATALAKHSERIIFQRI